MLMPLSWHLQQRIQSKSMSNWITLITRNANYPNAICATLHLPVLFSTFTFFYFTKKLACEKYGSSCYNPQQIEINFTEKSNNNSYQKIGHLEKFSFYRLAISRNRILN